MVGLIHVVNVHGLDFVYGNHYGVERFFAITKFILSKM
jgi:hypothetical protein